MMYHLLPVLIYVCLRPVNAFTQHHGVSLKVNKYAQFDPLKISTSNRVPGVQLYSSDPRLDEKFGGYTVKQRLREEIESPFRKIRLLFFASSTGSALTALYFSTLDLIKIKSGFTDVAPLNEVLQNCGINLAGAIVCAALAYRDYTIGQANLERIAKGGALASLRVSTADEERRTLKDYRRVSRVLIAAGGEEYVKFLARSLTADQLADENTIPEALQSSDVIVVPVLIDGKGVVGDTKVCWRETEAKEGDKNFDIDRANDVVVFPLGYGEWTDYLKSEVETAKKQGFDVAGKGITITVKKNGRILRRATGQPRWGDFLGAMEVLDGSKFGMPGDSEKYGGP